MYADLVFRRVGRSVKRALGRTRAALETGGTDRAGRGHISGEDRFRASLESQEAAISMDVSAASDAMLLAFGALKGKLDVPPFEFFTVTGDMPVKRVFVRDLYQAWYHRGLSEEAPSVEATADLLRQIVADQGVSRLVVAGASAGGYAALLFGALLEADAVLSFCPQTSIDPRHLEEMEDRRWEERPRLLFEAGQLEPRWLDLRQALPRSPRRAQTHFDVFFDETFRLDLLHAERIAEVEGVQLQRRRNGEHSITRNMRDSGELAQVLRGALEIRA